MAAADDDTRYQAKNYAGKRLEDRSYSARNYRAGRESDHRQYESADKKSGFWSYFGLGRREHGKPAPAPRTESGKTFQADKNGALKAEQPEAKVLTDAAQVETAPAPGKEFKASEKRPGRDPMLQPRQGIKAPVRKREE